MYRFEWFSGRAAVAVVGHGIGCGNRAFSDWCGLGAALCWWGIGEDVALRCQSVLVAVGADMGGLVLL